MPVKTDTIKVAVVQMNSSAAKAKNISTAVSLCQKAIAQGAEFILLPESFNSFIYGGSFSVAEPLSGPSLEPLLELARKCKVYILAGSICEKGPRDKAYNTSVLVDNKGRIIAKYRKMHLFDVSLKGKKISEAKIYLRGRAPILISVLGVKTGLSICYDLRFPELYRFYSRNGARILCVPSAFTEATGSAHWEVLLRSRAIENQCYILAPNQCGRSADGIMSYGNSMIISPWGEILARADKKSQKIIYAQIRLDELMDLRNGFPVLKHRLL